MGPLHHFSALTRYGMAVAVVSLALITTHAVIPLRMESPSSLFFAAVLVTACWGGLGPGLLATGLSAVALKWVLAEGGSTTPLLGVGDLVRLAAFLAVALLINGLSATRRKLELALRQRAEELIEADQRKDEFLAILAHELRNPLASIAHAAQVLRLHQSGDSVIEQAGEVTERQVRHLSRLIDDLLDISRITRRVVALKVQPVNLTAALEQAAATTRPLFEARDHTLRTSLPPAPLWLEADPTRLEQILVNLLNNAAKYTDRGGHIWISAQSEPGTIVIRVSDDGIGMTPAVLARAFDLFSQADPAAARARGGLGIGLTLVRSLVELHGGTVQAHSAGPGRGSEFIVRLPAAAEPALPEPALPEPVLPADPSPAPADRPRRRVLVIDDEVEAARGLAAVLDLWGHESSVAYDGVQALDLARSFQPDLILLDLDLPVLNGFQVARLLRQEVDLVSQPLLVAVTGHVGDEFRRQTFEAGFDRHLTKPISLEDLEQLLETAQNPQQDEPCLVSPPPISQVA